VKLAHQIPDFTNPADPASLGSGPASVARTAEDAGFEMLT
jgi:hypothetical protein